MDNKLNLAIKKRDFVISKFNDIDKSLNKDKNLKEYYTFNQNEFLENDISFEFLETMYNKRQEVINKIAKKQDELHNKPASLSDTETFVLAELLSICLNVFN